MKKLWQNCQMLSCETVLDEHKSPEHQNNTHDKEGGKRTTLPYQIGPTELNQQAPTRNRTQQYHHTPKEHISSDYL